MAEDTREGASEQDAAPLLHQPVGTDRPRPQLRHHVGEELKIAIIVDCVGLVNSRLADVTQGRVGSLPEPGEHGAVLVLQNPPLAYLVLVLPRNGLSLVHPLAKKERLGAGGSQFLLRRVEGSPGSVSPPLRFLQLGPQGSGSAFSLDPDQLQPLLELALEVLAGCRHPALNLFQDLGLTRSNVILRL